MKIRPLVIKGEFISETYQYQDPGTLTKSQGNKSSCHDCFLE